METVDHDADEQVGEQGRVEAVLPARVQGALGELVGAAKEGLLALSVGHWARRLERPDGRGG
jgi:hypothetical protein